jgi:hypothetical protein
VRRGGEEEESGPARQAPHAAHHALERGMCCREEERRRSARESEMMVKGSRSGDRGWAARKRRGGAGARWRERSRPGSGTTREAVMQPVAPADQAARGRAHARRRAASRKTVSRFLGKEHDRSSIRRTRINISVSSDVSWRELREPMNAGTGGEWARHVLDNPAKMSPVICGSPVAEILEH